MAARKKIISCTAIAIVLFVFNEQVSQVRPSRSLHRLARISLSLYISRNPCPQIRHDFFKLWV